MSVVAHVSSSFIRVCQSISQRYRFLCVFIFLLMPSIFIEMDDGGDVIIEIP